MQAYASIEVVIALTGLMALVLLPHTSRWLAPAFSQLAASPAAVNTLRLAVSFALLVVPAAAMGATLPVLMHALRGGPETFGVKAGFVYGANTLGAVVGTLGAELLLVPAIGVLASGARRRVPEPRGGDAGSTRESQGSPPQDSSQAEGSAVTKEPRAGHRRGWPLLIAGGC